MPYPHWPAPQRMVCWNESNGKPSQREALNLVKSFGWTGAPLRWIPFEYTWRTVRYPRTPRRQTEWRSGALVHLIRWHPIQTVSRLVAAALCNHINKAKSPGRTPRGSIQLTYWRMPPHGCRYTNQVLLALFTRRRHELSTQVRQMLEVRSRTMETYHAANTDNQPHTICH